VHTHIVHLRAPDPFLAPVNYIFTTSDRDADYEASYRPPNTTRSLGGLSELPTWIDPDEAAYEIRHRGKIIAIDGSVLAGVMEYLNRRLFAFRSLSGLLWKIYIDRMQLPSARYFSYKMFKVTTVSC